MNIKKVFGAILTILGIGGLICAAVLLINTHGGTRDIKALVMCSVLGIIFFIAGIGLIRST
jgi:uncharacterized membrane protein